LIFEFTKPNGEKVTKYNPAYVYISCQLSTPADSLTAVFIGEDYNDYKCVRVIYEDKVIFTGVVDEVKTTVNEDGLSHTYRCRSLAGCLLDTQLMPQNIQNINDTAIYHRYLKPYGITIKNLTGKPLKALVNISKGQSVYSLLNYFCGKLYNTQPRINQYGEAVLNGEINSSSFVFTNGCNNLESNCYSCTEIQVENKRYGVISRVYVRNTLNGSYGLTVKNKSAIEQDIDAVRYLDAEPSSGNCIYDADRIIENSNKASLAIKCKCPCFVFNPLGGEAKVVVNSKEYSNLEINSVSYMYSKNGVVTTITMNRKGQLNAG